MVVKLIVVVYIGYSTRRAVVRALSGLEVCCIFPERSDTHMGHDLLKLDDLTSFA